VSAEARVARAIIEVRDQLGKQDVPVDLRNAVLNLIDEVRVAVDLTNEDIEGYR